MAFKLKNLSVLSNPAKRGIIPLVWQYWDEDGDTITADGFFESLELNAGDQIMVTSKDYTTNTWYHVTEASQGKFTAVANTTAASK